MIGNVYLDAFERLKKGNAVEIHLSTLNPVEIESRAAKHHSSMRITVVVHGETRRQHASRVARRFHKREFLASKIKRATVCRREMTNRFRVFSIDGGLIGHLPVFVGH